MILGYDNSCICKHRHGKRAFKNDYNYITVIITNICSNCPCRKFIKAKPMEVVLTKEEIVIIMLGLDAVGYGNLFTYTARTKRELARQMLDKFKTMVDEV